VAAAETMGAGPGASAPLHHATAADRSRMHPDVDLPMHTNVDSTTVTQMPRLPAPAGSNTHVPDGPAQPTRIPESHVVPVLQPPLPNLTSVTPGSVHAPNSSSGRPMGRTPLPRVVGGDGVVGGTPVRSGGQPGVARPPRGTVIGDERSPAGSNPVGTSNPVRAGEGSGVTGRSPMGMGAHPGGGGAGAATSRQTGPGRRFASEPGGVAGHPRGQQQGRSEFTPGGSGLARGQALGGIPPVSGAAPGTTMRSQRSQRADYLTEDEETWSAGQRNTVPRVIE
jgi:hypothetical protein